MSERLHEYVTAFVGLSPDEVLSRLQLAGVVSDQCPDLIQVAIADDDRALDWISKHITE